MKKNKKQKKLQKIAKFLYDEFRQIEKSRYENEAIVKEAEFISLNIMDFDEKVSEKFKNFVINLIKLKDKIRISVSENQISISGNLDPNYSNYNSMVGGPGIKSSGEDYLEIRITNQDFTMSRNYSQPITYKDPNIYIELVSKIKEKSQEVNKDIIIDIIDDIMVRNNLSRESNLNEILN